MKFKKMNIILILSLLLHSICLPTGAQAVNTQDASVNYVFSGREASLAGYAEGTVTITPNGKTGYCTIYWADDDSVLEGYEKIAAKQITTNEQVVFNMVENMVIPQGATHLAVFFSSTEDCDPEDFSNAILYDIPKGKQFNSGKLEMTFASVSDVHVNYNSSDPNSNSYCGAPYKWTEALNYFADLNLEMVTISGDCTSAGGVSDYKTYVKCIDDSRYDESKVYMARGNHDSQQNANFINYTGHEDMIRPFTDSPWFYVLKKGGTGEKDNLFIFLAQELSAVANTHKQDNFSTQQLDWLEGLLKSYAGTNTNIFILEHAFYRNWGPGDRYNGAYSQPMMLNDSYTGNMRLQRLLMEYKEVIFMTGHSHLAFSEMVNYSDEKNTACRMIHNSSTAQLRTYTATGSISYRGEGRVDNLNGSEGYVVGIYENDIVYNGTNLTTKEKIPTACYIIQSYTEDRSKAKSIEVTKLPKKVVYEPGEYFDAEGMEVTATYQDGTKKVVQGWGLKNNLKLTSDDKEVTIVYGNLETKVTLGNTTTHTFQGNGTKASPYLIEDEADFAFLTQCFESSVGTDSHDANTFGKGMYFLQTADIDMTGYEGYGGTTARSGAKYGFSGVYNGNGHTIKVALSSSTSDLSIFPYVNGVVMNVNFRGSITADTQVQPIRTIGSNGKVINCSSVMTLNSSTANGLTLSFYGTAIRCFSNCVLNATAKNVYAKTSSGTYVDCKYDGSVTDSNATKVTDYTAVANSLNSHDSTSMTTAVNTLTTYDNRYSVRDINLWTDQLNVAVMAHSPTSLLSIIKTNLSSPVGGNTYKEVTTLSNYANEPIEVFACVAIYNSQDRLVDVVAKKVPLAAHEVKNVPFDLGLIAGSAEDTYRASMFLWSNTIKPYFVAT